MPIKLFELPIVLILNLIYLLQINHVRFLYIVLILSLGTSKKIFQIINKRV